MVVLNLLDTGVRERRNTFHMVHSPHVLLGEAGPDGESELTGAQKPRCIHYQYPATWTGSSLTNLPTPFGNIATKSMLCFAF